MRNALLIVGLLLLIGGGLVFAGVISLAGKDEVLRVGDTSVAVSRQGIEVSDPGERGRTLGIVLMVVGAIGVGAGALRRK
jgi:hypothetical protein